MTQLTKFQKTLQITLVSAGLGFSATSSLTAATLAHWQFEQGNFLGDSSGNNITLENNGIVQSGGTALIPGNPGTGFDSNADLVGSAGSTFTVEAFLNLDSVSARSPIYGEYFFNNSANNGWELYFNGSGNLVMAVANSNTQERFYNSGLSLTPGKDYYIGTAVDASQVVNDDGDNESLSVTFYTQNITDGGALQSSTITLTNQGNFRDAGSTFSIGVRQDFTGGNQFTGSIDEVRVSSGLLSQNELLISTIPEPSTYAMLFAAGAFAVALMRRKK